MIEITPIVFVLPKMLIAFFKNAIYVYQAAHAFAYKP
jgi:hypothetical protein